MVVGLPSGGSSLFLEMLNLLSEPIFILYVLHTSRGEGEVGRYQSPLLQKAEVESFVNRYLNYLSSDSRFDIWLHSPNEKITIVWERHNLIYIYGQSNKYLELLKSNGFCAGNPNMNFPHQHYYRSEFDAQAKAILSEYSWSFSSLKEADLQ